MTSGLWAQNYNPLGSVLSTVAAAVPVTVLFYLLVVRRTPAWRAAVYALLAAAALALAVYRMPPDKVAGAVAAGVVFGWFRMAWIVLGAVFVYEVTVETRQFQVIQRSIAGVSDDARLQVLLLAFAFGALLEGAGGGGAPVAITGAMMIGLGFPPFQTAVACLVANSAPVAFGGLGNPIRTLVAVTGLGEADFSAMVGRILPLTTLVLPFWLVRLWTGTRGTLEVWPALLACGLIFGGIQFAWSNFVDASLVDIVGGIGTLLLLSLFFRKVWRPANVWRLPGQQPRAPGDRPPDARQTLKAWMPFLLLALFVVVWGVPPVARALEALSPKLPVPYLHQAVLRHPPVVAKAYAEPAIFDVAWLSSVGTAGFIAGLIAGPLLGLSVRRTLEVFVETTVKLRTSLAAILAMLALGYVTRYSGMDAIMGMALAQTGWLYPLFGTLIGWLGVALSGSDAGSNALFGSLQAITATKLGLSPVLMGAANSAGGVMGKMIAPQSLVIACAATGLAGQEGALFRAVLKHSVVLVLLVAAIVMMYAYIFPGAIPSGHQYWR
jgi:lactate permease